MHIGVFDSGVGGLTILSSIDRLLPNAQRSYCCDRLNFPYGTKSSNEVLQCTLDITRAFFDRAKFDVLVIACNTASTIALADVRKALPIPVVGVVPAVKPAALLSKTKKIGVLATQAAVRQKYLTDLVETFASNCEVRLFGSSNLVDWAEKKLRGQPVSLVSLRDELQDVIQFSERGMDQLVMGCTHFPLLSDEIRALLPKTVTLVDSSSAVALQAKAVLEEQIQKNSQMTPQNSIEIKAYCSGPAFELTLADDLFSRPVKLAFHSL
ncbi:MAG: glutamate racemase [Proteobacteria bacterium]|nr:glutamate racemase [Pseudomonadota bacterium]